MTISSSLKVCPKGYIQTKTEEYFIFSYSWTYVRVSL
jgi:hypothetical protein